ncbi:hypothetical protein [Pedobacter sp. AJM]|uniref:hypothetical protein n=1 Tax=Pedobacter sp. AJM TaxID=2003629 RepID=UPI000B4A7782|nr:hypothetical protein [Pedobacter sp. AJM]OWK70937.1 hypothetical protein CBW18_07565 [Pedobacter sp. AJM]
MSIQKILISEKFHRQYKLLIETESMMVTALMKSKTEIRYDFSVLNIDSEGIECRLVQLDIFIKEANSNLIHEVAELTGAFNRMFNELHLKLDHNGRVIKVLNIELILSKWKQTKILMQQAANKSDDLKDLIALSDSMFESPEKIQHAIQANEFLQTYFGHIYGENIPSSKSDPNRTNFLNTSYLPFKVSLTIDQQTLNDQNIKVLTSSVPYVMLDMSYKKNAYKSFEDKLDLTSLNPVISENSIHIINQISGMLIHSEIIKKEIVHPEKLFTKMNFTMSIEGNSNEAKEESIQKKKSETRFKFF